MKRFILKVGISIVVIFLLLIMPYRYMMEYPNIWTRSSMEMNLKYSMDKLATLDSPKIVIMGGSGCGFGFMSQLISEHYQMPVVNTGTHAGIGLKMQLKLVEPFVRKNDILLIIPEYEQFSIKQFLGLEDATQYRIFKNIYPEALDKRDIIQKIGTLLLVPKYFVEAKQGTIPFEVTSPYSMTSLNEYGDITHWKQRSHQDVLTGTGKIKSRIACYPISYVHNYMDRKKKEGVHVFYLPPTFSQTAYDNNRNYITKLSTQLLDAGIPFQTSTWRYRFDDTLFYDTSYHLTEDGAKLRTTMVIHDLDSLLHQ